MKKLLVLTVLTALTGAAFAKVDPSQPMVAGKGNVSARPGQVMITNQTKPAAGKTDENKPVELMKFEVAGSPLRPAAKAAVQPKR